MSKFFISMFVFLVAVVAVIGLGLWVAGEEIGKWLCPPIDDDDDFWNGAV